MRACGSGWPRGVHRAGGCDRRTDARVGATRGAVHQIVKAGKAGDGDRPDRRTGGGADGRQRDEAAEAAPRDAAAAGRVMRVNSVKACIAMFRQMMFASESGMHRTLRAWRRVCRRASACLSVDENRAGESGAAPG
ncbi:hypothetical protein DF018_30905 [Burkholderia cenocepacia]|nr:hypothetical protein DF018_30905 [Burkholderia cenocepacia]